jgi:hypothetical protein
MQYSNNEIRADYIFGSLTSGTTYAVLSPEDKLIARSAAIVAESLSNKLDVLPGQIKAEASDYYDPNKKHGQVLKKAIQNTLTRIGNEGDEGWSIALKYLHGEFIVQAEARHIVAVAENKVTRSPSAYAAAGHVASKKKPFLDEMKKQADGNYNEISHYAQELITSDINTHYTKPEDLFEMVDIGVRDSEKPAYIGIDPKHNLDFKEDMNVIFVKNMIDNNQSLGNTDVEDAIRAVYAKVIAPLKIDGSKDGREAYEGAYKQMLMAGARVANLGSEIMAGARVANLGSEMTSRQAAAFMLNDMEIMKACQKKDTASHLHFMHMDEDNRYLMAQGEYGKLSEHVKSTVRDRLMSQDYVAPGLMQQVSKHISENENMPGPIAKALSVDQLAYQNSVMQQQGR